MTTPSPIELLAQLQNLVTKPPTELTTNPSLRTQLASAAKKVFLTLKKPEDVVARIFLSQWLFAYIISFKPVEGATIRIAIDLKLFSILKEGDKTLDELVEATHATPVLLSRVLRSLAAFGAVKEDGMQYILSANYEIFANQAFADGLASCGDFLNPAYLALPGYLSSTNYQAPHDPKNTAVQKAFDAKGKELIDILMERPDSARGFGTLMSTWGEGNSLIQDIYPINERLPLDFEKSSQQEQVMWVDVGGGYGQKTIALKHACPKLPGRFIVQDRPDTIENAPKTEGIENMGHDFFTKQPIKGARAYYIRQCLHNWPADKCVTILTEIRKAMKPKFSKLFVHELIVPERGASTWVVTQDFNMMTLCATMERTELQWRQMLSDAGLTIIGVYQAEDGVSEGVIEAEVTK